MSMLRGSREEEKGFTLIELLIVAIFIGILLVLAIPNFIKARISSNEANVRKIMQTLRDMEGVYFEQDLDNDGVRDYTAQIGNLSTAGTLRCPSDPGSGCTEKDALLDSSFEGAVASGVKANCPDSKSGYCVQFAGDVDGSDPVVLRGDFGWEASMTSAYRVGIRDFSVYGDKVIRCTVSTRTKGRPGAFESSHSAPFCD